MGGSMQMEPIKPKAKNGPEFFIQNLFVDFLEAKKWHVERMAMGQYMSGIPDLLIGHYKYGMRFIDIKVHGRYSFTKSQKNVWPIWEANNMGIWILGAKSQAECTKEHMLEEHKLLFEPPNWRKFWKKSWDKKPDIDKMIEDLNNEANNN